MRSMKTAIMLLGAMFALSAPGQASPAAGDGFDRLVGSWHCTGHFTASNRPISSKISFRRDSGSGGLVVHHDDELPAAYHALELWSFGDGTGFRAAIADSFTGMRWFSSSGWAGDRLTWSRPAEGAPREQFSYALQPSGDLRVEWLTARKDGALAIGDSLTCRRSNSSSALHKRAPDGAGSGQSRPTPAATRDRGRQA